MLGICASTIEIEVPSAQSIAVTDDTLTVDLADGRTICIPLEWNWRLIGAGYGIHWEDLNEDISIEGLLAGRRSGESQSSFKKWLESRTAETT